PNRGQLVLERIVGLRIDSMPVDSADDLYGLPLEDFIPERTALVRSLRGEKRREDATKVAGMRKPSVAAWTVNQLDGLLEAAAGLLSSEGHAPSPATLERVADTLRAASIDAASRQQVADGCLTQ